MKNVMEWEIKTLSCGCRNVLVCAPNTEVPVLSAAFLCCGSKAAELLPELLPMLTEHFGKDCRPFLLCSVQPADWGSDYTPWPAPALRADESAYTGCADDFFKFTEENIFPILAKRTGISLQPQDTALVGYSLGGLAALWQTVRSKRFGLCASVSGSLWYPDFTEWLLNRKSGLSGKSVYLSLGGMEEKARNELMRSVGVKTRKTAEILKSCTERSVLEWNKGGHFKDISLRLAKALLWLYKI